MADVESLLKKAADSYAPALGELGPQVGEKAFAKGSYFTETRVFRDEPYKIVRDTMIDVGTVLLDDEGGGTALAMLKGGAGGMAPVLLLAKIKDDIVALAAHELNNPLSTLGIGLETLLYRDAGTGGYAVPG